MADTIFTVYSGTGLLVKDFGSNYPAVLAALQMTTRQQGDDLRTADGMRLQIPTSKGTALFKSYVGSSHNPITDVKEYGMEYLGITEIVNLNTSPVTIASNLIDQPVLKQ